MWGFGLVGQSRLLSDTRRRNYAAARLAMLRAGEKDCCKNWVPDSGSIAARVEDLRCAMRGRDEETYSKYAGGIREK